MKKYISLFFILMMTAVTYAQTVGTTARELSQLSRQVARAIAQGNAFCIPWMQTVGDTGLYSFQLSRQLAREASDVLHNTLQAQKTIPAGHTVFLVSPIRNLHVDRRKVLAPLHESVPYLTRKKDLSHYLSTQENKHYVEEVERLHKTLWPQLDDALPRMERLASSLKQPKDPLRFVTHRITPSINYLLVGDIHGFPETKQALSSLLTRLRKKYPNKEIVMLTEFLPQGFVWQGQVPLNYDRNASYVPGFEKNGYISLWDEALKQNIPTVGMESVTTCASSRENYFNLADINAIGQRLPIFASAIGVKYRNEQFMEIIRFLRDKNPDALFVIYAGSGHLTYNAPFSLAEELKKEETFTLIISPSPQKMEEVLNISPQQSSALHPLRQYITKGNFPQKFLYWKDPSLAQIAGFDAYIQLE